MDTLKKWAYNKGYMLKKGSPMKETHLLFNGGRLLIPREAEEEFLATYARWVDKGKDLFVIEHKTYPTFRMFLDLDYQSTSEPSDAELRTVCKLVHETLCHIVCQDLTLRDARCIVSVADGVKRCKDGDFKRGVHMVWPDVLVDSVNALRARQWIAQALNERFGTNNWEQMVDPSVFKGSGLRLNGSIKRGMCSACRGRAPACPDCHGQGVIYDRRKYGPIICYRGLEEDGELLGKCKASTRVQIELTSIRAPLAEACKEGLEVPETYAEDEDDKVGTTGAGTGTGLTGTRLPPDPNPEELLSKELSDAFPDCFRRGEVLSDVMRMDGSDGAPYFLIHTNSRFCYNVGRCHKSNRIYFYATEAKIIQKCFCTCDTSEGRKTGPCKQYSSAPQRLSARLLQMLFPEAERDPLVVDMSKIPESMRGRVADALDEKGHAWHAKQEACDPLDVLATEAVLASAGWKR